MASNKKVIVKSGAEKEWEELSKKPIKEIEEKFHKDIENKKTAYMKNLDGFSQYKITEKEGTVNDFVKIFKEIVCLNASGKEGIYTSLYINFPPKIDLTKFFDCLAVVGSLGYSKYSDYEGQISLYKITSISPYFHGIYSFLFEVINNLSFKSVIEKNLVDSILNKCKNKELFVKLANTKKKIIKLIDGFGTIGYPKIDISSLSFNIVFDTGLHKTTYSLSHENFIVLKKLHEDEIKKLCIWISANMGGNKRTRIFCYPNRIVLSRTELKGTQTFKRYNTKLSSHREFEIFNDNVGKEAVSCIVANVKHSAKINMNINMTELPPTSVFDGFETDVTTTVKVETTAEKRKRIKDIEEGFMKTISKLISTEMITIEKVKLSNEVDTIVEDLPTLDLDNDDVSDEEPVDKESDNDD